MKYFLTLLLISMTVTSVPTLAAGSPVRILTFSQWKARRVSESRSVYQQLTRQYKVQSPQGFNPKLLRLRKRVDQARFNIDLAQDLNAHDYFIAYVSEQFPSDKRALAYAIKNLKIQDIGEILGQYQRSLHKERAPRVVRSNRGDHIHSDNTEIVPHLADSQTAELISGEVNPLGRR